MTGLNGVKSAQIGRFFRVRRAGDHEAVALGGAYAVMGVLLLAYLAYLAYRAFQGGGGGSRAISGWGVDLFELAAAGLCLARGLTRRPGRVVALTLGLALASWALGDVALTIESAGGATPRTSSTWASTRSPTWRR